MRIRRPIAIAVAFVVLLLCGLHSPAFGEGSSSDRARSRAHFQRGSRLYKDGKYDQAIVEYQAAYTALPIADFLFNIGQAYRLKGDADKALQFYNRYLHDAPQGGAAAEARENVAQLDKQVAAAHAEEQARIAREAEAARLQKIELTPPVSAEAEAPSRKPLYKKWWLWTAAGGVVVIALGVGLGVGLSGSSSPHFTDGTQSPFGAGK